MLTPMGFLYTLDMNSLPDIWFTNIFSHSIDWHCVVLVVSFAVEKALSLMSCVYMFWFYCLCFWCHSKKLHQQGQGQGVFPYVFFMSKTEKILNLKKPKAVKVIF